MNHKIIYLIAFITSFCLMVLEIVAGRLIAPYLGVSIYTWTSVIGVILAGLAFGGFFGGWLADKKDPNKVLSLAIFIAGFSSLASLLWVQGLGALVVNKSIFIPIVSLGIAFVSFFPPSFFLGMITPVLAKLALHNLGESGRVVGRIYAAGAGGSIAGTFASGYFLVALFGTRQIVIAISIVLIGLALLSFWRTNRKIPQVAIWFLILVPIAIYAVDRSICYKESVYNCIKVSYDAERSHILFTLDVLVHGSIYPDHKNLGYAYQQVFGLTTIYAAQEKQSPDLKMLMLGGGSYTLPRFLAREAADIDLEVVEIDPAVTEAAFELIGNLPSLKIIHEDARVYVNALGADKKYDLVIGDTINDYTVPYQLTTKEFVAKIFNQLSSAGIYAVVTVSSKSEFLASMYKTLSAVFPSVSVAAWQNKWATGERTTYVLIASKKELKRELWEKLKVFIPEQDRTAAYLIPQEEFEEFARKGFVLTDNYAPVEAMVARMFPRRLP